MKYKGKIIVVVLIALFIIPLASPLFSNGCDDTFCNIVLEGVIPMYLIDLFNGFDGVTAQYIRGNQVSNWTEINVNLTLASVPKELMISYSEKIERQELNNQAQLLLYPDGLPAPLCLRDLITGENQGLYLVNGTLFINEDDSRCVN